MNDEQLRAQLPSSTWAELPPEDREARCCSWCRFLWGDHEGIAAMGIGRPYKHIDTKTGELRYKHHDDFRQQFFDWPAQADEIGKAVVAVSASGHDAYIAPMLRTSRERRKVNGAGGRVAWADLDGEMTTQRRELIRRLGDAARLVSSGTGHHLYLQLDTWRTPDEVEAVNRALRDTFDADHKWSNDSFLRPPGSYSMKPLIMFGRTPALVQGVTV